MIGSNPGDHRYEYASAEHFDDLGVGRREETRHVLRFFAWSHLPERLQSISRPFGDLAITMLSLLPDNPELTAGLRKLLEAKDCAVRAAL